MKRRIPNRLMQAIALVVAQQGYAQSLPSGPQVTAGTATVSTSSATQLDVNQSSNRAVLRWDSFNVDAGNSVRFNQPDSSAATLNIVDDSGASILGGSLTADGSVFLVNPHGITITPTGSVDTGGAFIASTLSVSSTDFMDGLQQLQFSGTGGAVSNAGAISAGDVLLLGSTVNNSGSIVVPTGRVALGSASQATLDLSGDGFLQVLLPADGAAGPLIENSGSIAADGGLVQLKAATVRTALREAIHMPGSVRARSVSGSNGAIVFHGGEGGSMTITGSLDTLPDAGAMNGGSVELFGSVVDADYSQMQIGARGSFHLGVNQIYISPNGTGGPNTTGIIESGPDSSIGNLLSAGTDVRLQANDFLNWLGGVHIASHTLATDAEDKAGDLHLMAGGDISLGGQFITYNSNWTLTANAEPLVPAERVGEYSSISMYSHPSWATFIGNNGHLTLEILGGRKGDSIQVPQYTGAGLTARIDPGVTNYDEADIRPQGDVMASGPISLSGHLRPTTTEGVTLSGSTVTWTTEKTGGRLAGGQLRFIEDGVISRFGRGDGGPTWSGADALRLELGSGGSVARVYGDTQPDQAALGGRILSVAAHNTVAAPGISLADILADGSIAISGPGAQADVGDHYQLHLSPTASIAFAGGYAGGGEEGGGEGGGIRSVWIDTSGDTPAGNTVGLEITPRPLSASFLNPSYTYGSPQAAVTLAGLVSGDDVRPVASLDPGLHTLDALAGGYGFDARLPAGSHAFSLSGISGSDAGNYSLNFSGLGSGSLDIAAKELAWSAANSQSTYGSLPSFGVNLDGVLTGDDVVGIGGLSSDGVEVTLDARLDAGTYTSLVTGLQGADAGNYVLATAGSSTATHTVRPKALNWRVEDSSSVYGTLATPGAALLSGVLSGDAVTGEVTVATPQPLAADTDVGHYSQTVTALGGLDSHNYVLASTGNTPGTLSIAPRPLRYAGGSYTFEYGSTGGVLPGPSLSGVLAGDDVSATADATDYVQLSGSSGSFSDLAVGTWAVQLKNGNSFLQGADKHNYVLEESGSTPSTVTISPKPLNFVLGSNVTTYGTPVTPSVSLSGLVGKDEVYPGDIALSQGTQTALLGERTPAGDYVTTLASLSGYAAGNYSLASAGNTPGSLLVEPKLLNWHLGSRSSVYGDALPSGLPLTGVLAEDDVRPELAVRVGTTLETKPDVGTYPAVVTAIAGADAGNYLLASDGNTEGVWEIRPRPLSWHVTRGTSTYGLQHATDVLALDNLVPGDPEPKPTVRATDIWTGRRTTLNERTNAGRYRLEVIGFDDPNYTVASNGNTPGPLSIDPKPLRFSVPDSSSTYGSVPTFAPAQLDSSGVLSGDQVRILDTVLPLHPWELTERTPAGTYSIAPSGLTGRDSGNYALDWANSDTGTLTIHPKEISYNLRLRLRHSGGYVTFSNDHSSSDYGRWRAYDESGNWYEWDPSATLDGAHPADVAEGRISVAWDGPWRVPTSSLYAYRAGTYTWRAHLTGFAAGNYRLAPLQNQEVSHTIRPLKLSVGVWTDYDNFDRFQYGTTGFRRPDVVSRSSNADFFREHLDAWFDIDAIKYDLPGGLADTLPDRLPVGTYSYVQSGPLLRGTDAVNFELDLSTLGTIQVFPKPLEIVREPDFSIAYGEVLPRYRLGQVEGVLEGDEVVTRFENVIPDFNRNPAGVHRVRFSSELSGADADNYILYGTNEPSVVVTITPKPLDLEYEPARIYRDVPVSPSLIGVLPEDVDGVRAIGQVRLDGTFVPDTGVVLNAGEYDYDVELDGFAADNYSVTCRYCTMTIEPKPVTGVFSNTEATYGTATRWGYIVDGLYRRAGANDDVVGTFSYTNSNGRPVEYNARTPAGTYNLTVGELTGSDAPNYRLVNLGESVTQTIKPRPVSFTNAVSDRDLIYGDGIFLATLKGVLFDDHVQATGTRNGERISLERNSLNDYLDSRQDVGEYHYVLDGLGGRQGRNYVLTDPSSGNSGVAAGATSRVEANISIAPRPIRYQVQNQLGMYGNYQNCELPDCASHILRLRELEYGPVQFEWLVPGDDVRGDVGLIDFNGRSGSLDDVLPLGQYFQVVTGLSGADSHNYVLAESGSLPGMLEIRPRWVTWKTSSAVYMPETGMIGEPGIPALDAIPAGMDVSPVVQAFDPRGELVTDWEQDLIPGAYAFHVVALEGQDADHFRVLPAEVRTGSRSVYDSQTGTRHFLNYTGDLINDIGVLSVFADSRLGLRTTNQVNLPLPPDIQAPVVETGGNQAEVPNTDAADDSAAEDSGSGFGRNITLVFDEVADPDDEDFSTLLDTSQEASTSTATDIGEFSAEVSNYTRALAEVGITGVTLELSAEQRVTATYQVGPGFVEVGAGLETTVGAQAGLEGLNLSAESRADAYIGAGARGDLGGGVDGEVQVTQGVVAIAEASSGYSYKDGKIVVENSYMAAAGATAGGSGTLETEAGSVSAGATVYSPGVIGASLDVGAGFSDGRLSIDLAWGLGFGFGGLEFDLGFEVDFNEVVNFMSDVGSAISCFFGSCPSPPSPGEIARDGAGMTNDPMGRFRFLNENTEWRRLGDERTYNTANPATQRAYDDNLAFFNRFRDMIEGLEELVQRQQNLQRQFVEQLASDPEAAIETARTITTMNWNVVYNDLNMSQGHLDLLGVKLVAQNGKLRVRNQ